MQRDPRLKVQGSNCDPTAHNLINFQGNLILTSTKLNYHQGNMDYQCEKASFTFLHPIHSIFHYQVCKIGVCDLGLGICCTG